MVIAWTHLAFLAVGLGIGVIAGRSLRRSVSSASVADISNPVSYVESTLTETPPTPSLDDCQALQAELLRMQLAYQMAVEMGDFKAGFLARTSHELRSPLNGVLSLHQLVLNDLCEDQAEEREFIAQAYDSGQKMLALLDEMIAVSKLERGTSRLQLQSIQLDELLQTVHKATVLQARNRNVQLKFEPPDPDLFVLGDRRWLRQVLLNLVVMPLDYLDGGYVSLTLHPHPGTHQICLRFEDNRPAEAWSEPIDLLKSPATISTQDQLATLYAFMRRASQPNISSWPRACGLRLVTNQLLMQQMQGDLEIASTSAIDGITQINCVLAIADSAT
jgi:signal transduction histidine kinase